MLGLSSYEAWDEARFASAFDLLFAVCMIAPHRSRQAVLNWVGHSAIQDRACLASLAPYKSIKALAAAVEYDHRQFLAVFDHAVDQTWKWGTTQLLRSC